MFKKSFLKVYFLLILWICSFYGYASEKLPPPSPVKQAENSVVLLYDPFSDLSGTGFLIGSNRLIANTDVIRNLFHHGGVSVTLVVNSESKVTIHDLKIEKLIAVDEISSLALLEIKR